MFEAKVYKVMVGCPGDSMEELLVAKRVIAQWNEQNAEREKESCSILLSGKLQNATYRI